MSEVVSLKLDQQGHGLDVPIEALKLLWRLERAGFTFAADRGRFIVTPNRTDAPSLSEKDRASVRKWKKHLQTVAIYQATEPDIIFGEGGSISPPDSVSDRSEASPETTDRRPDGGSDSEQDRTGLLEPD